MASIASRPGPDGHPRRSGNPCAAVIASFPQDTESLDTLRALSTIGRFTGDICRCHGGPTVVLRDNCGQVTTSASIHGFGSVSWDRPRFRNDLDVVDATGLHLFLVRQGVPHQIGLFLTPLTELLNLHESRPQFRPAGKRGRRHLAERQVPDVLHPLLLKFTGEQVGSFGRAGRERPSDTHRSDKLTCRPGGNPAALARPAPRARRGALGEGVLVRRLLADLSHADLAAAASTTNSAHIIMVVVNAIMHSDDNLQLGQVVAPALHRLLPPR